MEPVVITGLGVVYCLGDTAMELRIDMRCLAHRSVPVPGSVPQPRPPAWTRGGQCTSGA